MGQGRRKHGKRKGEEERRRREREGQKEKGELGRKIGKEIRARNGGRHGEKGEDGGRKGRIEQCSHPVMKLEHALGFAVPTSSQSSSSPFLFLPGPL